MFGEFNKSPQFKMSRIFLITLLFQHFISFQVQAGTIVRVDTSVGYYSMELLDETAPITVENFLNYANRNDFNGTYLHRVETDFVVQGGGFRFELFVGPIDVVSDPPIQNEFNVPNTRGTVAMAKFGGDPDSATNQWFVNLADNRANLDNQNGGFTVFAQVLGNGIAVLDEIDNLPKQILGDKAPNAPFFTDVYTNPLDFVYMNVEVVDRYSESLHVYEDRLGKLIFRVNVNEGEEIVALNMNRVPSASGLVLQVDPNSVIPARDVGQIATFSSTDNRLRIPILEANLSGSVQTATNVVFQLTDPTQLLFTLESYDP